MNQVAIIYWSGTGNTQAMAQSVLEGAQSKGASAQIFTPSEFQADRIREFDTLAFGCPAMGAEVLEEEEFEPLFAECESKLSGKKIALFGSYGWGGGEWMRDWEERCRACGANQITESVICENMPEDSTLERCRVLGELLAE